MTDPTITIETVQQKFGSCLLRLQECELLLKWLVAHTDITVPLEQTPEAKTASAHGQTMGKVAGMFTKGTLVQDGAIRVPLTSPDDSRARVRFTHQIQLSSEQYDALHLGLKQLIDLRNELAHHFLQRFNIQNLDGHTAAIAHLDACSPIIDAHRSTLLGFTNAFNLSRTHLASFVDSQEFEDAILQSGLPD